MERGTDLNTRGYSEKVEKRILDVFDRALLKEFPNSDRTGCPGSVVLKRIASHEMPLAEAEKWFDHLGSCSPCFGEFTQLRSSFRRRRNRALLAIAASILVVSGVTSWVLLLKQRQPVAAVLDLRDRSFSRGAESNLAVPPLEIDRNVSRLQVYLPLGSADGTYEMSITTEEGSPVLTGNGIARVKAGITSLTLDVNLSSGWSGLYVLQFRKVGSEWNSYPIRVK